jgi:hypothetical protein
MRLLFDSCRPTEMMDYSWYPIGVIETSIKSEHIQYASGWEALVPLARERPRETVCISPASCIRKLFCQGADNFQPIPISNIGLMLK